MVEIPSRGVAHRVCGGSATRCETGPAVAGLFSYYSNIAMYYVLYDTQRGTILNKRHIMCTIGLWSENYDVSNFNSPRIGGTTKFVIDRDFATCEHGRGNGSGRCRPT